MSDRIEEVYNSSGAVKNVGGAVQNFQGFVDNHGGSVAPKPYRFLPNLTGLYRKPGRSA